MDIDFNANIDSQIKQIVKLFSLEQAKGWKRPYSELARSLGVYLVDSGINKGEVCNILNISSSAIHTWCLASQSGELKKIIPPPKKLQVIASETKSISTIKPQFSEAPLMCEVLLPSGTVLKLNTINSEIINSIEKGVHLAGKFN